MITALETGVKGGRWYSLLDKVAAERTLQAAWTRVQRNRGAAGVDRQSIAAFAAHAERYLTELADALRRGRYRPQPVKRVWIEKTGSRERRPLGIPTVKDRIVQTALKLVLEPIFEAGFAEQSYGFRPGRGCKDALRRVETLLQAGQVWVVDVDIQHYFDTIPQDRVLAAVEQQVADGRVLDLLRRMLEQGVLEGLERWEPEAGTPQGAVISPLLANIYLTPLDHLLGARGWAMVRYADDLVVLCPNRAEAEAALAAIETWMTAQGLRLHPEKTRIVDAREQGGFDFLGYHFERGMHWPKPASTKRLRGAIKAKTRRSRGDSLATIIAELNPIIRGWYSYYRHGHPTTFPRLDGYIRMRLRSILRKRDGRAGRGRGSDHQRWPNAFFIDHGLFTMTTARRSTGGSR
ncbi:MAG TPA: group II intron reverse transcriptase/maturase [Solirubrobacteraceae bacterium]|nr:group II intron reverse transcriptase/maturase [Solirubrobacteraceae bacterium]